VEEVRHRDWEMVNEDQEDRESSKAVERIDLAEHAHAAGRREIGLWA
jgi:hypothetical protein